jgi:methylaspartate ammonia-lyase
VVRCPVCTKIQVVYVQGPTRTSCYYCGARWIQQGADQDGIIGLGSPQSVLRPMGRFHPTTEETR